ncbi:MAG TPA: SOS response-associated peptidase [Solirubrobacteraceae bacterium]|nr:SOS response-associated peptidase [Solirubrobacteraceae bacterium]
MCGRYTNTGRPDELNDRLRVPILSDAGTGRYNVAPTEQVLVVISPKGEPEARMMRWGLVPSWATDVKSGPLAINARSETVATNGMFKRLVGTGTRRALQIADGWYEWLKPEKRGELKQPFHFQVDGGEPFAFAALWTPAKIDGEWMQSVTLLTTDSAPNPIARSIHNRMPVVLADPEARAAWLDHSLDAEAALELCGALPSDRLSAHPANPAVNRVDPETEGPQLLHIPQA